MILVNYSSHDSSVALCIDYLACALEKDLFATKA
jgi:hypothetical protein